MKKNTIENIVPIVISVKHLFEQKHSPLLKDLLLCLKEIMQVRGGEGRGAWCVNVCSLHTVTVLSCNESQPCNVEQLDLCVVDVTILLELIIRANILLLWGACFVQLYQSS